MLEGTLSFIALADDHCGMFDDLVIGIAGQVVGHQYKSSAKPQPVGIRGLLLGADNLIADCASSFTILETEFPGKYIRVRYVTSHYASSNDKGRFGVAGQDSADFFREKSRHPEQTLAEWRAGIWQPIIDELLQASGLAETDFERFFGRFEIVLGAPPSVELNPALDALARTQIVELARTLGDLVGRDDGKTRWSRRELLDELGWPDRSRQRFEHRFPLGAHVQSNEKSEGELEQAIAACSSGYLCLLGPPGAGKSTLLERFVRSGPGRNVVRYLAYVPGTAQQQGRGEAANFLSDLNSQLIGSGLQSSRAKDDTPEQRRETFERLLGQATRRYASDGTLTIIVVDGLDHVPREEKPDTSFLRALPLPQSVPDGVIFILGSQRIELRDIPREVRDQASLDGRRIEITPLTAAAVEDMVASAGLAGEVDSSAVFEVSRGHPLVTQYLLGKLLSADKDEQKKLLNGGFEYDGDLDKVYRSAWREAEEADGEVSKVLFTLGFAEGRIEPELLADCLSKIAVNNAYKIAHHLIDHSGQGWQIFHNSFRLFLRQQTITLYGRPDPDFADARVYGRLAELAKLAPDVSMQRWLEFRYRFLAGDREAAANIASRRYFIWQFVDGRQSHDVSNDIRSAFACLDAGQQLPERVFDLMLAKDEVWRRQDALDMSEHLVAAQIAAGDLAAAEGQLGSSHTSGDAWLVIEALLENAQPGRGRAIFDDQSPWEWFDNGDRRGSERSLESWADKAVVLLDDEQIERRIRKPNGKDYDHRETLVGETPDDHLARLRFALAGSILRHDPDRRVTDVAAQHNIDIEDLATLHLESAEANLRASRADKALTSLGDYEACCDAEELHGSWHVHAARLAIESGGVELAGRLFAKAQLPNLCGLRHHSEGVEQATRYLIRYCTTAAQLGLGPPQPALPDEMLFRSMQHQAVRLGMTIGDLKMERSTTPTTILARIKIALNTMASATPSRHDDMLLGYCIRHAVEPLFDAICDIVRLAPDAAPSFASEFESCLQLPVCNFRERFDIRRKFTETMFAFDGDASSAVSRLESARREVEGARSPHEAIDRLAELAIGFGRMGFQARAREILNEMRSLSLGVYLPAKKDAQYVLWSDCLIAANRADSSRAEERSFTMLKLVAGVNNSDAYNQASRISKEVLVEAIACDAAPAWEAFDWAKASGIWEWNALIDSVARGMVRRRPDLAVPLAIAWTTLCLPYYDEEYNSVTHTGQFLRDVVATAPLEIFSEIERIVAAGLECHAKPSERPRLLRIFRDALADRGRASPLVSAMVQRWNAEPAHDEDQQPDYFMLESLGDVERAVASERDRREAQTSIHYGDFVSDTLGKRTARILAGAAWSDVEAFAARNPALLRDRLVKRAVAKAAIAAGKRDYAEGVLFEGKPEIEDSLGWTDGALREYHSARHLLEFDDAHDRAREDFIRDLVAGGSGTGYALWSIEELFPLLFRDVDWASLWTLLAEQIEGYRDYQKASTLPHGSGAQHDDIDLIVRLFRDAASFGVTEPRMQAAAGLLEMAKAGKVEIFSRACQAFTEGEGTEVLFGTRLLFEARGYDGVADVFRDRMERLAAHEDVCVAALGEVLSSEWGGGARMTEADLPPLYSLQLPPMSETGGRSLRDEESHGPVIDDPAAWTEGFEPWVEELSNYSGVPTSNIRHRVAQLVSGWGGVGKFGAKAADQLQRNLAPLGLLLTFVRPHIGICLRALHVIVGELWRASKLSEMEVDILLSRLAGGPVLPPQGVVAARPAECTWPHLPKDSWRPEAEHWPNTADLKRFSPGDHVVGEWARFVSLKSRSLFCEEMLLTRGTQMHDSENLDGAIAQLLEAYWSHGRMMVGTQSRGKPSGMRNLRISLVGDRAEALTFDVVLAQRLGWHQSPDDPFRFSSEKGVMATTRFWRDGWQQDAGHTSDMHYAEGQRVELSQVGHAELERLGGLSSPVVSRWRTIKPPSPEPKSASRWRSDGEPQAV